MNRFQRMFSGILSVFSLVLVFSGSAFAVEPNSPELWDEYLALEKSFQEEMKSTDLALRVTGIARAFEDQALFRARASVAVDYLRQKLRENFSLWMSGKEGNRSFELDASAELRVLEDELFMILHEFTSTDPELDTADLWENVGKWFMTPLPEDFWKMIEQGRTLLAPEDSEKNEIENTFLEALRVGKIFILTKREISASQVIYTMHLNKTGILSLLQKKGEILESEDSDLGEVILEGARNFLPKINVVITMKINPGDLSRYSGLISLTLRDINQEFSLLSLRIAFSGTINSPVNVSKPENAAKLESFE